LTANDVSSLTSATATKIQVTDNTTYIFLIKDGRKGVIRTFKLSTASTAKNVDVSVKALTKYILLFCKKSPIFQ
jgi:hypothetical protein